MARFSCLTVFLVGRKKWSKYSPKSVDVVKGISNVNLQAKNEDLKKPSNEDVGEENNFDASVTFGIREKCSPFGVQVVGEENSARTEADPEAAYEAGDEHEEILSMKRDFSDVDLQARAAYNEFNFHGLDGRNTELNNHVVENKSMRDDGITSLALFQDEHLSDPGMGRTTTLWGSPMLKRSCSNIETKRGNRSRMFVPMKSHSYDDLQNLSRNAEGDPPNAIQSSPQSIVTNRSADKVMLKKRSSSQVLPSRSKKLWWKLFLWSHRNLHKPLMMKSEKQVSVRGAPNQIVGYSSDTLEPSSTIDKKKKKVIEEPVNGSPTDVWPQSQWVAFSAESSSLDRVSAWVNSLEVGPSCPIDDDDDDDNDDGEERGAFIFPSSLDIKELSAKNHSSASRRLEEVMQANNIIQTLNSVSSVAHISDMGLKIIPPISAFSSLRSVNLSGNFIVQISPGSLPKSLQSLDLSRNKIAAIEGLRDLTRLRVLNLSYNRISRIGHGLSNCTLIRELYLAGNKISDVEGLHRLLKLTVLDLSFNKITTAKALGQLVANYNSLLALNLLGNPVQTNIGDEQLKKSLSGLLPQLTYLNKQPIKPLRAREAATDGISKAVLGNGGWSSRKRSSVRRVSSRDGGGHRGLTSGSGSGSGSKYRSKNRQQHSSSRMK